jgi:hypothetical protein
MPKWLPSPFLYCSILLTSPQPRRCNQNHLPTTALPSSRWSATTIAGEPPCMLLSPLGASWPSPPCRASRTCARCLVEAHREDLRVSGALSHRRRPCHPSAVLGYGPVALGLKRNPFSFPFRLNSSLNFENSYLFEYLSKINETSSVGFLISSSIQ